MQQNPACPRKFHALFSKISQLYADSGSFLAWVLSSISTAAVATKYRLVYRTL
jgi:hypothetical protein